MSVQSSILFPINLNDHENKIDEKKSDCLPEGFVTSACKYHTLSWANTTPKCVPVFHIYIEKWNCLKVLVLHQKAMFITYEWWRRNWLSAYFLWKTPVNSFHSFCAPLHQHQLSTLLKHYFAPGTESVLIFFFLKTHLYLPPLSLSVHGAKAG